MKIANVLFPMFNPYKVCTLEIYVSGCTNNCSGCCNKELQSFDFGYDLDLNVLKQYIKERIELIKCISFLGGDLLCQDINEAKQLVKELTNNFKVKYWLFTGKNEIPSKWKWVKTYFDVIKIGEYDKNAEYEISLSEFEYELYEKTSYLR